VNSWAYVNTKENPADCASIGIKPSSLKELSFWWQGPSWISKDGMAYRKTRFQYTRKKAKGGLSITIARKHPILLPTKHHGGAQLTLNHLRSKIWIIIGKTRVQSTLN
jgi:hypothetical protein